MFLLDRQNTDKNLCFDMGFILGIATIKAYDDFTSI